MKRHVTVIDYECGNLFSVARALEYAGANVEVTNDPRRIEQADRLLLPGVGAFGAAIESLRARGLSDAIGRFAATQRPFLGICLGMQLMFDASEEFGLHQGLALLRGRVVAIPATDSVNGRTRPVPHIGWGALVPGVRSWAGTICGGLEPGAFVYFVHSFAAAPVDADEVLATCDYDGETVVSVVTRANICGCQFHPEKSGPNGLRILANFLRL